MSRCTLGFLCLVAACDTPWKWSTMGSTSTTSTPTSPAGCTDPDPTLVGEAFASRTLFRACSPYRLASPASFVGDGVVLTIEPGVTIEAAAGASLRVIDGARLAAGVPAGEEIVLRSADGAGPWAGLVLYDDAAVGHELHGVTISGAAGTPVSVGAAALAVWSGEVLLDAVRIEGAADVGLRLHQEGATLAPGSDVAVIGAGGYPVELDAQNLPTLPPDADLSSADPERDRILVLGGREGLVLGDTVWPRTAVPLEIAVALSVGDDDETGSLELPSSGTVLFGAIGGISVSNGELFAVGEDPACAGDVSACTLTLGAADPGAPWASIVFPSATSAGGSRIENVRLTGGGNNQAMVTIIAPTIPGDTGDCAPTVVVSGAWFDGSERCLSTTDSSNPYGAENSFHGCAPDLHCD
jgi:hypothetical protein